ncbi:MAG: glutathione S-transferase N-terminal domain-containing protein [Candidatus Ryanbacteria bacterium]|nr:glutathione S-transferase N-terminal domain-containing protein [Candidatus Ryanbacteria bacterium]
MKKVEIYTTPACVYCKKAKEFFSKHGITYTEYNVLENSARADEMIHKSGQMGVPVIAVDGKLIIGYDERRLKELLDL